ncbi:MAG: hypothetical protein PHO02_03420 [Candidatus Nanoarchaeia archaeon]|nr:hypothetical protein [Candidatus Nanoarchaeia archaeon]
MKGISGKEMEIVSELEFKNQYFFTREEIKRHFTSANEMNVYLHRMRKKGRIIKLNKHTYYLIPVRAIGGKWSEHPYAIIDEIMDGKGYCIAGKAAAYYWKHMEQIPFQYEVFNTRMQKKMEIFHAKINFIKKRKENLPKITEREIRGHRFLIATKGESRKWS